jgi:2-polyprenyl-3-methyl-5-hydroxy-6-metoxy-1,4-benzoquinol methylase
MSIAGDLTNSNYWEEVWAARPQDEGNLAQLHRLSQWKYDRMIRRMLDTVSPQAEILELGCAPGTMLQRIHRLRPQLRLNGIDYAEEGCRTTAAMLKGLGLPPHVYHGDVRTIELPPKFDLVTSFGLIEHFDDPANIVRCHARFCRPGGTVAIALPNFTSPLVRYFADRFCPDNLAIHNLNIMNPKALKSAMQEAGLKDIRVGGDGGNRMHVLISRHDLTSRAYAVAGRIWNAGSILVPPQIGWHSHLWAIGTV